MTPQIPHPAHRRSAPRNARSGQPALRGAARAGAGLRLHPGPAHHAAHAPRRRGAAPLLFDLRRRRRRRAARGDQESAGRRVLHLREREPQARRCHRRAHAGGALSHRARPRQRQALRRLRRRQRHHAGALADQDHAQARAAQPLHPAVRQPPPGDRDVPGGAGGPEGPLPRPASRSTTCSAASIRTSSCSTAASTPPR